MSHTLNNNMPTIFLSHSSQDAELVKLFVRAARMGFGLSREDIRFSSEAGYGFEPGQSLGDQTRKQGTKADIFIAITTPNSLNSDWVKAELGARWGAGKPIYFVIANGVQFEEIPSPYRDVVAKSCTVEGLQSLFRLIGEKIERPYDFESGSEFLRDAEQYSEAMGKARNDKPGDTVTEHKATAEVTFITPVTGTMHRSPVNYEIECTKLPDKGNSLWLCVEVDKKVWPKDPIHFQSANSSFKLSVKEGGDSTYFFLLVVEVDSAGNKRIEKWFADGKANNNDYPGIEDMKGAVVAHTQVIRKVQ